jgi:dienelactone hydrolase
MRQHVVLFHSALGLRPAVLSWAERLRAAGYTVATPDAFDGEVFDTLEEGERKRDALGIPALIARAQAAVADLPAGIVVAGFSMGAAAAEVLAATRPGVRGAILMHGALDPAGVGVARWPRVPVQLHYAKGDPGIDERAVGALAAAAGTSGAHAEVHVYPGSGHLFADDAGPDHDPVSAALMFRRVLAFLAQI